MTSIRFLSNCRDGISWFKGDTGEIVNTLSTKPQATTNIYIIKTNRDNLVWATSEDVEEWNQLSLI